MNDIFDRWEEAGLYTTRPINEDNPEKKFFIIFAYPGPSGYMHVGHLLSYTYPDVASKFRMLQGYNVYFPAGIHASGLPAVQFSEKVKSGKYSQYLKDNNASEADINAFHTPEGVVEFFRNNYASTWKKMGYFIDVETGIPTSIDEGYKRFIHWQFRKLHRLGYLVQKPYISPICPVDGPVAIDTAETDLSEGGSAEINQFTIILMELNDNPSKKIPVATMRPETIFGVTNIWINPQSSYQEIILSDHRIWIIAEEAIPNFFTDEDIIARKQIPVTELITKKVKNPIAESILPIIPSSFVEPAIGTGVVMSVPAHSPVDWIALQKSKIDIPCTKVIESTITGIPAETVVKKHKVKSLTQNKSLQSSVEEINSIEVSEGVLNSHSSHYAGKKVPEARKLIIKDLIDSEIGFQEFLFNQKVVCRCGRRIRIRYVPDQWFINYSNETITESAKSHIEQMRIFPDQFHKHFPKIMDWFADRPCIRKGNWLGTEFPFNKPNDEWIIEPIADSSIYPIYYIISKAIQQQHIQPDQLIDEVFEYIYYGTGSITAIARNIKITEDVLKRYRREFEYWYPLDMNFGGKEHRTVHFPAFVKMHQMMFSENYQPRGIFVNWWVSGKNKEKISKSKGGAQSVTDAIEKFSQDAIRLFYCHNGSPHVDTEWDDRKVRIYQNELERIRKLVDKIITSRSDKADIAINKNLEIWFMEELKTIFRKIYQAFDSYEFRIASQEIIYSIPRIINRFIARGGVFTSNVINTIEKWIVYLAPVVPFLAEELWNMFGHKKSIFQERILDTSPEQISQSEVFEEEYFIENVVKDILDVKKIFRKSKPTAIDIFTSNDKFSTGLTEAEVLRKALEYLEHKTHLKIRINPENNFQKPRKLPQTRKVVLSIQ